MTAVSGMKAMIRIGTRGSDLARWQANWVAEQLRGLHPGLIVELVEIKTQGDHDRNSPLAAIGGVGLFTKEIQRAVQNRSVDIAVHSLKDLPTQHSDELLLAAVPVRGDMADALIAPRHRTIEALPRAARVGTSSPRRRAQLLFLRPDLEIVAVGQGALGIECRRKDEAVVTLVEPLNDAVTHRAVLAERAALAALEGGCNLPMAAWARDVKGNEALEEGPSLTIDAAVFDPDGRDRVAITLRGSRDDPEALGRRVAQNLLDHGAKPLLARIG
jgi:hydroxymethylbilane synthase